MTESPTDAPRPDDGFDARRLRTLTDMRRTRDDRIVAGVCAGLARHLDVDPTVVRIATAVLTFLGGAGLILYVAAWLFLPSEDTQRSVAADWFNLGDNEPQVRTVGLVVAGVVAALSFISDTAWSGWDAWWLAIPAGFVAWAVVGSSRREEKVAEAAQAWQHGTEGTFLAGTTTTSTPGDPVAAVPTTVIDPMTGTTRVVPPGAPLPRPRRPRRERGGGALLALTASVTAIATAITYLVDRSEDVPWTVYLAVALGVIVLGLLVGTVAGNAGPLVPFGVLVAIALVLGSLVPGGRVGDLRETPLSTAELQRHYELGMGRFELDLSQVQDPAALAGRTVEVETGIGETIVWVPEGVPVQVDASVLAGDTQVLGVSSGGTKVENLGSELGDESTPPLTIEVDHTLGRVQVEER